MKEEAVFIGEERKLSIEQCHAFVENRYEKKKYVLEHLNSIALLLFLSSNDKIKPIIPNLSGFSIRICFRDLSNIKR